jgi:hypothetical protein
LQRVVLICLGIAIALLLSEGIARWLPLWPDEFFQSDECYGLAHIPDASGVWINADFPLAFRSRVTINSKGLHDVENSYEKDEGVYRILVLGDSIADAFEVPIKEAFPARLESLLDQGQHETRFEVINGGHLSFGTDDELLFYRCEGYKYQPDLVLLVFTVSNDVFDNSHTLNPHVDRPYFTLNKGQLELHNFSVEGEGPAHTVEKPRGPLDSLKVFLYTHSKLYRFAGHIVKRNSWSWSAIARLGPMGRGGPSPATSVASLDFSVFKTPYPPAWQDAFILTEKLIQEIKEEAEAHEAQLVVIVVPNPYQLEWKSDLDLDWDAPNRRLTQILQRQGISYLDLLPLLRAYKASSPQEALYIKGDGHWSAAGHAQAARLIYEYLVENKLVPQ